MSERISEIAIRASMVAALVFSGHVFAKEQTIHIPSEPQSIPFELQDNLVRIEVVVNGQRQSGVLDSGAATLAVDRSVGKKLGLREGESAGNVAGAGTEVKQLLPVNIAHLVAGPLRFENIDGHAMDLGHLSSSAGFPIDVLVGAPAFKQGSVAVDYPGRRLTFGPSGSAQKCDAPIPLEIAHDVPIVDIELRTKNDAPPVRLKVMVDLGTRHAALVLGGPFVRSEAGKALIREGASQQIGQGIGGKV